MEINSKTIEYIATGGAIYGAGGGGDPYIGMLMAKKALDEYGPVKVVPVEDIPEDEYMFPACMMGAPTVMLEKFPSGTEIVNSFQRLGKHLGKDPAAVVCIEAGGLNSTIPFIVAAQMGLPIVDGDGMGRAFPELQMVTMTLHDIPATPLVLCDDKPNTVLLETISNKWTEQLARASVIEMGGSVMLSFYPMTGAQARKALIKNSVSLIYKVGKAVHDARIENYDAIEAVCELSGGQVIFNGRVTDVERKTEGGFARGKSKIVGLNDDKDSTLELSFQNEFLIALKDGVPVTLTPDLITVLHADTGEPVTTEQIRYGQRVKVIAIPCDDAWRSDAAIEIVGPRYFKYDYDYQTIDQLNPSK